MMQLLSDTLPQRQFKEWSMAYIGPSQSAEEAVGRVTRDLSSSNTDQVARGLVLHEPDDRGRAADTRERRCPQVIRVMD
jgi:hypothetical protein